MSYQELITIDVVSAYLEFAHEINEQKQNFYTKQIEIWLMELNLLKNAKKGTKKPQKPKEPKLLKPKFIEEEKDGLIYIKLGDEILTITNNGNS